MRPQELLLEEAVAEAGAADILTEGHGRAVRLDHLHLRPQIEIRRIRLHDQAQAHLSGHFLGSRQWRGVKDQGALLVSAELAEQVLVGGILRNRQLG